MIVTATELKNRLDQYLETAQAEPVVIEKSGRASSVMLSKRRFDELVEMEEHYWDLKARLAEDEGFISDDIDWCLYKYRHLVENAFARLKHFRAIATRYDKLKINFESMLALACALIWLPM